MLKLINAWVKNVYRWCIKEFKTSASLSPTDAQKTINNQFSNVQLQLIHQTINFLPNYLSTVKMSILSLLNKSYTHNPQYLLLRPKNIN